MGRETGIPRTSPRCRSKMALPSSRRTSSGKERIASRAAGWRMAALTPEVSHIWDIRSTKRAAFRAPTLTGPQGGACRRRGLSTREGVRRVRLRSGAPGGRECAENLGPVGHDAGSGLSSLSSRTRSRTARGKRARRIAANGGEGSALCFPATRHSPLATRCCRSPLATSSWSYPCSPLVTSFGCYATALRRSVMWLRAGHPPFLLDLCATRPSTSPKSNLIFRSTSRKRVARSTMIDSNARARPTHVFEEIAYP